jgi:hypothetical protein
VPRSRLVDQLPSDAGPLPRLVLGSAPAGLGKTTLLSQWLTQEPRFVIDNLVEEVDVIGELRCQRWHNNFGGRGASAYPDSDRTVKPARGAPAVHSDGIRRTQRPGLCW